MTGVMVFLWLLAFVIGVLWILMPFAIFGSKPLLRELIAEQKRTNALLQEAAERAKAQSALLPNERFREH